MQDTGKVQEPGMPEGVRAWEWEGTSTGVWDGKEPWRRNEPGMVQEPERGKGMSTGQGLREDEGVWDGARSWLVGGSSAGA